jgi:opacity protein-like surface antigen
MLLGTISIHIDDCADRSKEREEHDDLLLCSSRHFLGKTAIVAVLIGVGSAHAENATIGQHRWEGFYIGFAAGTTFGQYDPRTATNVGGYIGSPGAAAVDAAGIQAIRPSGFITGIEGGYNWQSGNLLLGADADLQAVNLQGATSSGAVPYPAKLGQFTVTSYGNINWLLTARPRIGFVAPNNWLFYATGGLALTQLQSDFSFVDSTRALESGRLDNTKIGYAVGAGIEVPVTNRLSVKADYLHVDFANTSGTMNANTLALTFPSQTFTHSSDLKADIFRAGLNYRFGGTDVSPSSDPIMALKAPAWKTAQPVNIDWEFQTGARLWFSSGTLGAPNPFGTLIYASRLTYSKLDAISGEAFARVDHASGLFAKGFVGAGGMENGRLNDEDTGVENKVTHLTEPYSNTLSSASGSIAYATIDVGYNFLRTHGTKVGAFVGYNYNEQVINAYGCTQIAGGAPCSSLPQSLLGVTQNEHSKALRVGLSGEVMLSQRLKLTTEVAYLPSVTFSGLDDHVLRQLLYFENSDSGDGVMLEASLDYKITDAWSMGLGGRYWAWNLNTGTSAATFLTSGAAGVARVRFDNERYGVFLQTNYRWGDNIPAATGKNMPIKALVTAPAPMNWTAFYVGGHMGGGLSDDRWSDPFGSTITVTGVDVAGFGDHTHATGPLGGAQIGANWQTGPLVLGVQADVSAAHMRGENTCFTGLAGVDCQHVVNLLGTLTGRAGYAWGRSLAYLKGGAALADTTYNLFANTLAAKLGTGSTTLDTWGWTLGVGIEFALTNHWTTFAEYDHIGVQNTTVSFPTIAVVNTRSGGVEQSIDLFKLGVNYKFDLAALGATVAQR